MGWFSKETANSELKPSILREKIEALNEQGLSNAEIAEELDINPKRVVNVLDYERSKARKGGNPVSDFFAAYKEMKEFEAGIKKEILDDLEDRDDGNWIKDLVPLITKFMGAKNDGMDEPTKRSQKPLSEYTGPARNDTSGDASLQQAVKTNRGRPRKVEE